MDTDHVGNRAAPVHSELTLNACAAPMTHAGDGLTAQFIAWVRADGCVDRFVRDLHGRIIWPDTLEHAGNMLGRTLPVQHGQHGAHQDVIVMELGLTGRQGTPRLAQRERPQACAGPVTAHVSARVKVVVAPFMQPKPFSQCPAGMPC